MISARTITSIIDALKAGTPPQVTPEDIPCFSAQALADSPNVTAEHLQEICSKLTQADIPTLERALTSLELNDQAWLGFKIVLDKEAYLSTDPMSPDRGPGEDAVSGVFFANEGKDIVAARPYNKRDRFQMLDVTRGPSMHTDQFQGVTWLSVPLFTTQRVVIYGAGEVSRFLERYAHDCGFDTLVIDDDPAFLTAERFPLSTLVSVESNWDELAAKVQLGPDDYCVCVSRGHVHDVDSVVHCAPSPAFYAGMMGSAGKNADVYARALELGVTQEQLDRLYAPIGVKIADKTPQEIAISIIAELIDVRGKARKETAARVAEQLA